MNFIRRRIADRKLTCARCQAVGRAFTNLDECNEIVISMTAAEPGSYDAERLPQWRETLADCERELVGETRPDSWEIKRGEECIFVEVSGAHYLHLTCAEKYLEDVRRVLVAP